MERDWTQKPAHHAVRFEEWQFDWIAPGNDRQLVNCSIAAQNAPTSAAHVPANLREPLTAVKWLVIPAPGVAHSRIEIIETHQVRVVRGSEEKLGAGTRDAPHFAQRFSHTGNMFDGFAGDYQVKRFISERQSLRVALNKRRPSSVPQRLQFFQADA